LDVVPTGVCARWNDFEDVCVGAVEWDVARVLSDARAGLTTGLGFDGSESP
jgi:hypothetical protein